MNKKIITAFEDLGFKVTILDENLYGLTYDAINMVCRIIPDDTHFLDVGMPFDITKNSHETTCRLINQINVRLKYVKAYKKDNTLWVVCERDLNDDEEVKIQIREVVYCLVNAMHFYLDLTQERVDLPSEPN